MLINDIETDISPVADKHSMRDNHVTIVGAGIAGLTTALYTSRQNLRTLVIGKDLGGQAIMAAKIENYPGFHFTSGLDLLERIRAQAEVFGTEVHYDEVTETHKHGDGFVVKTVQNEYVSQCLVLAFGKTPRDLGLEGENRFKGKGISYCTICDGPLFKGKVVATVGLGNIGVESVAYLSELANKVYYLTSEATLSGESELIEKVSKASNVEVLPHSKIARLIGDSKLRSIDIVNLVNNRPISVDVDGLFVELGYVARTDFLKGFVQMNERGEIIVDRLGHTSQEGVFAAGDVTDMPHKQLVIAAGSGAVVGLEVIDYLFRRMGRTPITTDWGRLAPGPK